MNFDFPTLLVAGAAVTGIIWLLDALIWAPGRRRRLESAGAAPTADETGEGEARAAPKEPVIVEYSRSFFPVILIVLVLRSFVMEPFRIPSGSMMPTLLVGDFILVNKFAYGLRLPVTNTKILGLGEPERGDVVVFRYPRDPSLDYIKRVVGLPGDRIAYRDKILYVNGQRMGQESKGAYRDEGAGRSMNGARLKLEHLGDVNHRVLIRSVAPAVDGEVVVPPDHFFVMGDNRDNSNDSRVWGFVPEENLVGKAFVIWMNWDGVAGGINWSRIGDSIR